MAKLKNKRFSDTLVVAAQGEQVDLLVSIDRASTDYAAGAAARKAKDKRDPSKGLNWVLGWDEAK